jgi:hypothetical protein
MSTRISSDILRIEKDNEISTFVGRYHLNAPGPGIDTKYNNDPQVRLQKFGANMRTNMVGIEEELMCRVKHLSRDYLDIDDYKKDCVVSEKKRYGDSVDSPVLDSRSELPAWTYRGLDQHYDRFEHVWINPQNNVERNFNHNIQTRLMEKESITDKSSCLLSYW